MKERPILFSGPMVRAILDGTKTQTRRVLVKQPLDIIPMNGEMTGIQWVGLTKRPPDAKGLVFRCRLGVPGDRLWVRESGWEPKEPTERELREGADTWPKYSYDADGIDAYNAEQYKEWGWKRRPSIFMPRWASRITLEVTDVRVERVQEISEPDAAAEGADPVGIAPSFYDAYRQLWDFLNAKRGFGWEKNPWVWAITFRKVT